ncbi:MAG: metallophosphoesterase family protein [Longimicrobiales bacterium]
MRIAALFDIYGNLPALEAVLANVRAARVDRLVIGGDIVVGPMTREALAHVRALDLPVEFIYGNCEVAVLDHLAGRTPKVPPTYRPIIEWSADQHRADRDVIASWPLTRRLDVPGIGAVLFCHATPRGAGTAVGSRGYPREKSNPYPEPFIDAKARPIRNRESPAVRTLLLRLQSRSPHCYDASSARKYTRSGMSRSHRQLAPAVHGSGSMPRCRFSRTSVSTGCSESMGGRQPPSK